MNLRHRIRILFSLGLACAAPLLCTSALAQAPVLVEPSNDDRQRAKSLMEPMWSEWAKKHGTVAQRMLDDASRVCAVN